MSKIDFELALSHEGLIKGFIWKEESPTKGIVLICHGMAEHINRYDDFATFLSKNGYIVYGHDQRGHGMSLKSMADMGYMSDIDNFKILVSDVREMVNYISDKHPNLPIYLLGHSMGSFVSQRYIELFGTTINGCILSGSTLNKGLLINTGHFIAKTIVKFKGRRYRSKLLNNLSFGAYNKAFEPTRTNFDWLSRDEKMVDAYVNDEYCGQIFTASFFKDLLQGFKDIYRNIEIIPNDLPVLIFSGDKDPVGNAGKNVTKLYDKLVQTGIKDIQFKLYPDGRHEMLNEINRREVYNDVLNWLNTKVKE